MRKFAAILLALCFAVLGSGLAEHLHNAHHAAQDARLLAAADAAGQSAPALPLHDESNCAFHLQLHLPALPVLIAPPVAWVGLLVCIISVAIPSLAPQRALIRLDCRGPPTRFSH